MAKKITPLRAIQLGILKGIGMDFIEPMTALHAGLFIADKIKSHKQKKKIAELEKELKKYSLTKAEKELGGYWLLDHLDKQDRLPYLNKIAKYAISHKDPKVQKAAQNFQSKYGNATLEPTYFAGQTMMLPKNKAGYIRAHRKVMEKVF